MGAIATANEAGALESLAVREAVIRAHNVDEPGLIAANSLLTRTPITRSGKRRKVKKWTKNTFDQSRKYLYQSHEKRSPKWS